MSVTDGGSMADDNYEETGNDTEEMSAIIGSTQLATARTINNNAS